MRRLAACVFVSSLLACGSSIPPPTDQFAAAQRDLGRAQEGGAEGVPDAKLHFQLAQEMLAKGKALMNEDNAHATSLIARATAEAELALNLAREAQAQAQAQQASDALNKAKGGSQ